MLHHSISQENAVTQNNGTADGFVPVIDIAPYLAGTSDGKRQVAAQLDRACREVGFYVIVGHGVDPGLVEQVESISREFFDLPLDEKMKVHIGKVPGGVGYSAVGDVALAYTRGQVTPPDLNETFQIAKVDVTDDAYFQSETARGMIPRNRWPELPGGAQGAIHQILCANGRAGSRSDAAVGAGARSA